MCSGWRWCRGRVSGQRCCGCASEGRGRRESRCPDWRRSASQGRGCANDAGGHRCGSRGIFRLGYSSLRRGGCGHGRRCEMPGSSLGSKYRRSGGSSLVAGGEHQQHEEGSQTCTEKSDMSPEKRMRRDGTGHEKYRLGRTSKVQDTAKGLPVFFRQYAYVWSRRYCHNTTAGADRTSRARVGGSKMRGRKAQVLAIAR